MYTEYRMFFYSFSILFLCLLIDIFIYTPIIEQHDIHDLLTKLRHNSKSFKRSLPSFSGKGIVIPFYPFSNNTAIDILLLVDSLHLLNCSLPLCVIYNSHLTDYSAISLLRTEHIHCIDIVEKISIDPIELDGRHFRSFSLLYSPFNDVLFIDPSVLLFINPSSFFDSEHYKSTGTLFWRRSLPISFSTKKTFRFLNSILPYKKMDNPMLLKQSSTAQDSTIILFNKSSHIKSLHKLFLLNKYWDTTFTYLDMDHDTFWISSELSKEPYTFYPSPPGSIGDTHSKFPLYFYNENIAFIPSRLDTSCEYSQYKPHSTHSRFIQTPDSILQLLNSYKQSIHDIHTRFQNHSTDFYDTDYVFEEEL
jgi:hypothetical protein